MEIIPFSLFYERLTKATPIDTQAGLATALGVHRSAITQAKNRDAVPHKWILALARRYQLSPDWLEFGKGTPSPAAPVQSAPGVPNSQKTQQAVAHRPTRQPSQEMVHVPLISATLCAGAGSFEVEGAVLAKHPFPYSFLSPMGTPSAMVFMHVMGDSMEPFILDGDMVLVDQAQHQPARQGVYAVGFEDAIYVKRLECAQNAVRLLSDNPEYAPIEIMGDELHSFRILGKVVWLCRDCRFA
ncbi:LexA family transcriptional regulator [Desulfovibrio cuneatus]|uniref:LexA family transcriptional regulator n=1 Tax=Desulfovibrio cuneatus TaxID=159728 RepID=UPI00040B8EB6|nr:helix-turn-helix transcriptional regulator [Desulfovibrio cuneatus]